MIGTLVARIMRCPPGFPITIVPSMTYEWTVKSATTSAIRQGTESVLMILSVGECPAIGGTATEIAGANDRVGRQEHQCELPSPL